MQQTFYVENTALYLANRRGEGVLSTKGNKLHRPIVSKAKASTYTPYADITLVQRKSEQATLTVGTWLDANTILDDTDKAQMSPYDMPGFIGTDLMKVLNDKVEKNFLANISSAANTVDGQTVGGASGSFVSFSGPTIYDVFEAASTKLRSVDAPIEGRVAVLGPHEVSAIRKLKMERESGLGDSIMANGVIGPWGGWTIVESNNLPWSASLNIATQPTDGDTVTIAGQVFTFKTTLGSTAGQVLIGGSASAARTNLLNAVTGGGTPGTDYIDLSITYDHIVRNKRGMGGAIVSNAINFTGYGDVVVSSSLTATADGWTSQLHGSYFGVEGAIDLIVQIDPNSIEFTRKEKGHADIWKGLLGMGSNMFGDGQLVSVYVKNDASTWK